ncbi:MAG: DEAD/DEAH box helicase [Terriglobia bacterium]
MASPTGVNHKTDTVELGTHVRSLNSMYRDYGVGRVYKVRDGLCKVEFNPSVFSLPPFRSENFILSLDEVEVCPTPLERAKAGEWEEAWKFDLRQMAARFLTTNKGGQLSNARTEILPHQIFTAYTVVSSPRRRFMLADEVGLGKTIEAGMVWQALFQRGYANRTLIITPAGLTRQWQEEFKDKFQADDFEIFGRDFTATNPRIWDLRARAIASLDRLKRKEHKRILLENRPWDLIIFDEAHRLGAKEYGRKTDRTQNYQLAEALRGYTDALLLLTGTPHSGDPDHSRFMNLVRLLEPKVDFSTLTNQPLFREAGAVPYAKLILRTPKLRVTDAEGKVVFKGRMTHPLPFAMYPDEKEFYTAVEDYIRTGYNSIEKIEDPMHKRAVGFILTTFQKLNASSFQAIKAALEGRLARLGKKLEELPEEEEEDRDERFQGELDERDVVLKSDREILKDEIKTLTKLLAIKVTREKKIDSLRELLKKIDTETPGAKVLIFTEYRRTQEFLKERLEKWYGANTVVLINGGMELEAKTPDAESKRRSQRVFREEPSVRFLVSTEAGGEGINLQFCHIVVNYDLPWNPMRYEQRVGRVYRYGQDKVVQIYNLRAKDTVEDMVRTYFEQRLKVAALALQEVTGEKPEDLIASLNWQLETEIEPDEIYKRALVEGTLNKQTKEEIQEAVRRSQKAYEIATQSLFRDVSSYSFDKYKKELASPVTLKDLEGFTLKYLARERRQVLRKDGFMEFLTPESLRELRLPERFKAVTFDRATAIKNSQAEFFALGHRFVDSMLQQVGDYSFGGHTTVRVIEAAGLKPGEGKAGYQFNFMVRSRVQREDGEEYLFDSHTIVINADGSADESLAKWAESSYSREGPVPRCADELLANLESLDAERAYDLARAALEGKVQLWDWEEDVDLIGLAKVVGVPAG